MNILDCQQFDQPGRWRDRYGIENSYPPVRLRERKVQRPKSQGQTQRFVSTRSAIYNIFNIQRRQAAGKAMRDMRSAAMAEWIAASAAAA